MKSKIKLITLLCLIPFLFISCKDDEPQYLGEFRLGAQGEAYIKFEPGSYWVYENDKTAERDTFELRQYNSYIQSYEGLSYEFTKETIEFSWVKNKMSVYYFEPFRVFVDATRRQGLNPSTDIYSFRHYSPGFSGSCIFYYPFTQDYSGSVSGQRTTVSAIFDSLQVSDEWFYDVAVFELDNDWLWNTFNSNHTKYYWAKNVGLIRKVLLEENSSNEIESYNLVKYQVTQ